LKRKINSIGRVLIALVLLGMSLVMAAPVSAQGNTIYTLGASAGNTAVWSTVQKVSGTYSALLSYNTGDNAYVEFTPQTGITVTDVTTITTGWGYWYYFSTTSGGPNLELRFTSADNVDPDGAGHVDINVQVVTPAVQNTWTNQLITSASVCYFYGNDPVDGTAFSGFLPTPAALSGVLTAINATSEMAAHAGATAAAWELTRVRAEIGWGGPARTCYIDDITIDDVLYELDLIVLTPPVGLETTEAGGTDTFTIVLNSQPTASVLVALTSSDTTEGTVSPTSVTFTTANWDDPRTVTVTGVDDILNDGNTAYTINGLSSSADPLYAGSTFDVNVTNEDNDPSIIATPDVGLETTEAGGTDTFTVVLSMEPTATVLIALVSSDESEGTVSPIFLIFTTTNWDDPQTVTVTGVDDDVYDDDQDYTIDGTSSSTDPLYAGLTFSVEVTNLDVGDVVGITVTPIVGLETTEAGGTDTFTIVLNTEPTANVTILLSSNDTTEGLVSTVAFPIPAATVTVTFTSANWDDPQEVTVTGIDDVAVDGNIVYSIITAAAAGAAEYVGINAADVGVTNLDNEVGITVTPISGLETGEDETTDTFTIVLNTEPTANVTIALSSSDLTEGTVSPASVTFTSANWDTPQTVTVTGVDDSVVDGNVAYTIDGVSSSTDPDYDDLEFSVGVTNIDDDLPGGGTDILAAIQDIEDKLDSGVFGLEAIKDAIDAIDISGLTTKIDAIEDKLDIGGTFYTFVDDWFTTIGGYVDTEVAAILAAVDTEVAAIKANTDTIVWADITAIKGYVDTEVAAILAAVDTEVAAIKAKTDTLPTLNSSAGSQTLAANGGSVTIVALGTTPLLGTLSIQSNGTNGTGYDVDVYTGTTWITVVESGALKAAYPVSGFGLRITNDTTAQKIVTYVVVYHKGP